MGKNACATSALPAATSKTSRHMTRRKETTMTENTKKKLFKFTDMIATISYPTLLRLQYVCAALLVLSACVLLYLGHVWNAATSLSYAMVIGFIIFSQNRDIRNFKKMTQELDDHTALLMKEIEKVSLKFLEKSIPTHWENQAVTIKPSCHICNDLTATFKNKNGEWIALECPKGCKPDSVKIEAALKGIVMAFQSLEYTPPPPSPSQSSPTLN